MSYRAIHKFPLMGERTVMHGPFCSTDITTVMVQDGNPFIWTEVNRTRDAEQSTRTFLIRGTGFTYETEGKSEKYIGSIINGDFVWHVVEEISQ